MSAQLYIHPVMTGKQISDWCLEHRMRVQIRYVPPQVGFLALEAHPASNVQVLAFPDLPEEPVYGEA